MTTLPLHLRVALFCWSFLAPLVTAFVSYLGFSHGRRYKEEQDYREVSQGDQGPSNDLETFFDSHHQGRGIWKWRHYFDIYDRYFKKFRGREVHIVEVGIYSGGSLEMWKHYFGSQCRIYGVDIEESCRVYEDDAVQVFIGNQADRKFWREFKKRVPRVDILVDDGGHLPHQQIITLEEMLPHLRPGGVYLCEDVQREFNPFAAYMSGLVHALNAKKNWEVNMENGLRRSVCQPTGLQASVESIHFYPYVTVIQKAHKRKQELIASKHGTSWEPFLK